jgi:hypothetical protein
VNGGAKAKRCEEWSSTDIEEIRKRETEKEKRKG